MANTKNQSMHQICSSVSLVLGVCLSLACLQSRSAPNITNVTNSYNGPIVNVPLPRVLQSVAEIMVG